MKLFRTLRDTFRASPTKLKVVAGATFATLVVAGAAVFAGFGPSRPVYDWNKPADRAGSMDGPVFNSFINTPVYGDERAFVDAKPATSTTPGGFKDQQPVEPGKEYTVRLYVHNNANESINGTNLNGKGVAVNTRVKVKLLGGLANGHGITGYITSDNGIDKNGNPLREVYDTVDFRNENTKFAVQYVPGSARIENAVNPGGKALSDSIVTDSGALIGWEDMNGKVPGCFEFSAYVTIKVKVVAPVLENVKQVRRLDTTAYGETATVKPGEKVAWKIAVNNTGQTNLTNVITTDTLPAHLKVVPGSVRWIYVTTGGGQGETVLPDNDLFTKNLDFGALGPGGGYILRFDTEALGDFAECEKTVTNVALSKSTELPNYVKDNASVKIVKENCVQPAFNCEGLDVAKINRTTFRFTGRGSASGGANITGYIFKVNGDTKQDSTSDTFTFVEDTPGDYTVTVQVKTNLGTTAVSDVCTKKVTVEEEQENPVFSCDLLEAQRVSGRTYRFTTRFTADGGAKVKHFIYNFGDNTPAMTTDKSTVEHTYAADGTYAASVKTVFTVNGEEKTVESDKCRVTITISPQPVTPTQPTKLPVTGSGEIASVFTVSTLAGAFWHRRRSLRRQ